MEFTNNQVVLVLPLEPLKALPDTSPDDDRNHAFLGKIEHIQGFTVCIRKLTPEENNCDTTDCIDLHWINLQTERIDLVPVDASADTLMCLDQHVCTALCA